MAGTKRSEGHAINVAVVGLSGTDKEKGVTGVGKSCLCNRFVRSLADQYYTDHISVLSQSDFGGRVVNNDHYLYWGEVTKTNDEGMDYTFRVIEQTEFIDDSTFTPFRIGKTEPYHKRCALTKLQSAEKLMYLCKNQLGLEQEFEQQLLPDGKFLVDGFVCVFDVSDVSQRTVEKQVEMTAQILNSLIKTKKPVVLATTKNDEARDGQLKEVEKLVTRKEFRGLVHLVETSALLNVNVECAFLLLAHLIEKTRSRPKVMSYTEAARIRTERMEVARDAYTKLISTLVTDHKMFWILAHKSLQTLPDYVHFVELFSTEKAKEIFQRHTTHLREQFIQSRKQQHFERLKQLLPVILPDLDIIADRSWMTIMRWLPSQSFYDTYFLPIAKSESWRDPRFLENTDDRFPSDLLDTTDADQIFRNHAKGLRAEQRRHELMHQFKQLIEEKQTLVRGKALRDAYVVFMGHDCYINLSDADRQQVYDDAQQEQRDRARQDFHELLLENMPLVTSLERRQRMLTAEDLNGILDVLRGEPRYEAVTRPEDRKTVLMNLLGFIQHSSRERCQAKGKCADLIIQQVLNKKGHRPTSLLQNSEFLLDSGDRHLNLIFLGQEPLADELVSRVRALCVNDQYTSDGVDYSLDYRPIDGDVSLPQNSFKTASFIPNGCFCVYNSTESLEYVRDSLEKTLFSEAEDSESDSHLHGLPIVIVLAHDPAIVSEQALEDLRIRGHELANRLQCSFTDTPSSLLLDSADLFHSDQVALAMHSMVQDICQRSQFIRSGAALDASRGSTPTPASDIRVLLATMCGDQVPVDLILAPLLSHQLCYVTADKAPIITLETMVNDMRYKVEVIVCSYHNAMLLRRDLHHGLILVYSTRRKASLSNLRALVTQPLRAPTLMLAVMEGQAGTDSLSKTLLAEGTNFAQNIGASFVTVTNTFAQQTTTFTPFFVTCLGEKDATVRNYLQARQAAEQPQREHAESVGERMARRPPAELPVGASTRAFVPGERHNGIMWNNEPIHSRLRSYHSDSDLEGVGSPSPPPPPVSPYGDQDDDEIYSEIGSGDTALLLPYQSSTPNADSRASSAGRPRHRVDFSRQSRTLNSLGSTSQHSMSDARKTSLTSGAPLALPEHVEINSDYADVRDAIVPRERPSVGEPLYADVQDALPEGTKRRVRMSHIRSQSARGEATSDSETDVASRLDIYKLMQRRPTPYKKKPSKQQQRSMDFERHLPHRQLTVPAVDHRHFAEAMNQSLGEYSRSTVDDVWTQRPARNKLQRSKAAGDSGSETIGSEGASWAESDFASGQRRGKSRFSFFSNDANKHPRQR